VKEDEFVQVVNDTERHNVWAVEENVKGEKIREDPIGMYEGNEENILNRVRERD